MESDAAFLDDCRDPVGIGGMQGLVYWLSFGAEEGRERASGGSGRFAIVCELLCGWW